MTEYLNESDLNFVDDILMKYGNDNAILGVSELDGFLTAIVSGPDMIMPGQWVPEVWAARTTRPSGNPKRNSNALCISSWR